MKVLMNENVCFPKINSVSFFKGKLKIKKPTNYEIFFKLVASLTKLITEINYI